MILPLYPNKIGLMSKHLDFIEINCVDVGVNKIELSEVKVTFSLLTYKLIFVFVGLNMNVSILS